MLPLNIGFTPKCEAVSLKRHVYPTSDGLSSGSVITGNITAITYSGNQRWKVRIHASPVNWSVGMNCTIAGTTYFNGTYKILAIDTANPYYVYIEDTGLDKSKSQSTTVGTLALSGVVPLFIDTMDETKVVNNNGDLIGNQYDEAGYFYFKVNRGLLPYSCLQVIVNSAGTGDSVQIDLATSLNGLNWDLLLDEVGTIMQNLAVPESGVTSASNCSKTIWIDKIAEDTYVRIYVHDLASTPTYYILVR